MPGRPLHLPGARRETLTGRTASVLGHLLLTHSNRTGDTRVMKPSETANIAFDRPGTYADAGTFHTQNMKGTVTVTS